MNSENPSKKPKWSRYPEGSTIVLNDPSKSTRIEKPLKPNPNDTREYWASIARQDKRDKDEG